MSPTPGPGATLRGRIEGFEKGRPAGHRDCTRESSTLLGKRARSRPPRGQAASSGGGVPREVGRRRGGGRGGAGSSGVPGTFLRQALNPLLATITGCAHLPFPRASSAATRATPTRCGGGAEVGLRMRRRARGSKGARAGVPASLQVRRQRSAGGASGRRRRPQDRGPRRRACPRSGRDPGRRAGRETPECATASRARSGGDEDGSS